MVSFAVHGDVVEDVVVVADAEEIGVVNLVGPMRFRPIMTLANGKQTTLRLTLLKLWVTLIGDFNNQPDKGGLAQGWGDEFNEDLGEDAVEDMEVGPDVGALDQEEEEEEQAGLD